MRKFKLSVEGRWILFVLLIVAIAVYVVIWNYTEGDMDEMATIEEDGSIGVAYREFVDYAKIRPSTTIVFDSAEKEIGRLEWGSGKFHFIGEADESAKVFFKYFLKPYIDQYIEEELKRRKDDKQN